jgi:DNA polymerase-1
MTKQNQHLVLIDGYGFLFRAFHAYPPLTRADGVNVGGVFGFTSMLIKVILEFSCSHLAVAFDPGGKNFRHTMYPEYKAHRPPVPEDLIPQFPLIREAVASLNIDILEKVGFEADDVIATLAKMASNQGIKVTIISSDKDLMQLIDDNISMYDPLKSKTIKSEQVLEKFGVRPDQVTDVLALIGDASDNVPGVPGIGPKGAAELISQFHDLANLYQNIPSLKESKRKQSLIDNKEIAFLSQKLVILDDQVDTGIQLDDLQVKISHVDQFKDFLKKQNFHSLHNKAEKICQDLYQNNEQHHDPVRSIKIQELRNKQELEAWLMRKVHQSGNLSIILEAGFLCLACDNKEIAIIEGSSSVGLFQTGSQMHELTASLLPYLHDTSVTKIVHDAKRLYHITNASWQADDIQLMSYVLNNGVHAHDLKTLVNTYFPQEPGIELKQFLAFSSLFMLELWSKFKQRLIGEKLLILYERVEKPLSQALFHIEKKGMKISQSRLNEIAKDFTERSLTLEQEIYKLANCQFNIGSPKQLAEVLFDKMGLKSKTAKNSTNADVLEELAIEGHKIAEVIMAWRHLTKLNNTYANNLGTNADNEGRIHTSFQMTVTSTGRLSSVNPNLQNIPIRTEDGLKIRSAFVSKEGCSLISADYSQIELRLLASMADVPSLKQAFAEGKDIHSITASEVFDIKLEDVTKELRRQAKAINFGIIYGQSAFGLASQLGISRTIANKYIEDYFIKYPGIKQYMEQTKEFARQNGYVETLFGRRIYISSINDANGGIRNFAERAAINAPLQGTAADIIKKAMIQLDIELQKQNLPANIIMQIHDELIIEAREDKLIEVKNLSKTIMDSVTTLKVPLIVNVSSAKNWAEL